ncbi:MAG: flagellar biosynthesis repressor FlbT [Pseudomonadota bacterium]
MHLTLRAGERLFLNGAVLRTDRKVSLELLNDATFLLENHVLQVEDTTTPLRQLYFAAQAMLMDPQNADASRSLFLSMAKDLAAALPARPLTQGLKEAVDQVQSDRPFHALKTLRSLFAEEAALLAPDAGENGPLEPGGGNPAAITQHRQHASERPTASSRAPEARDLKPGRTDDEDEAMGVAVSPPRYGPPIGSTLPTTPSPRPLS